MTFVSLRDTLKTKGTGYIDPKDCAAMTDLVMNYQHDKHPNIDAMMTNKFVGKSNFTHAEWGQVQKNSQEFRTYLT